MTVVPVLTDHVVMVQIEQKEHFHLEARALGLHCCIVSVVSGKNNMVRR